MNKEMAVISRNGKQVRILKEQESEFEGVEDKQQVFIIGSKGIPAAYGGFETFVEKLTEYQVNGDICYHVSCLGKDNLRYEYNGAECFTVTVPNIGSAGAVYYDLAALNACITYCKERPGIKRPVFYILACRIGPFISFYKKQIRKLGGVLYVNPDGHEWKRSKWSLPVRAYWKISERCMVKYADLLICDSKNIKKYVEKRYRRYDPNAVFIAYGSEVRLSALPDDDARFMEWMADKDLRVEAYYLVVGRFVPENNFETMIREFMKSETKRDLAIITTVNTSLMEELRQKLHFEEDSRIKFVGTVYDQELLKKIRENAYGYLHGHEVGGTNPSLLEALGITNLNLLLNVGFNREVAEDTALYWSKSEGSLASLIDRADVMSEEKIMILGEKAKRRMRQYYSWEYIVDEYEKVFLSADNTV